MTLFGVCVDQAFWLSFKACVACCWGKVCCLYSINT